MTGLSHTAANGAICFALCGDPVSAGFAVVFARFPDQSEKFLPWVRHRTLTHHLWFWLLCSLVVWGAKWAGMFSGLPWWAPSVLLGFFVGSLLHVLMDMFSKSGVPVFPGKVWGARVYTTGSYSEYLFLGGVLLFCCAVFLALHPSVISDLRQIRGK